MKTYLLILTYMACVLIASCKNSEDNRLKNSRQFFEKITSGTGIWTNHPKDTVNLFKTLIMQFQLKGQDTLIGLISGQKRSGDTLPIWKIREYADKKRNVVVYEQNGKMGNAKSVSSFPQPQTRIAAFEILYSNGAKESYRDRHTFLNDTLIQTESEIYDPGNAVWIAQPVIRWTKVKEL